MNQDKNNNNGNDLNSKKTNNPETNHVKKCPKLINLTKNLHKKRDSDNKFIMKLTLTIFTIH